LRITAEWIATMAKKNPWLVGWATALVLPLFASPLLAQPEYSAEFLTDIPTGSRGMVSGPEVGARSPDFEALDQNGNLVSLADVMGPSGAMVVFIRSADW
jgi:hypothetical protein